MGAAISTSENRFRTYLMAFTPDGQSLVSALGGVVMLQDIQSRKVQSLLTSTVHLRLPLCQTDHNLRQDCLTTPSGD